MANYSLCVVGSNFITQKGLIYPCIDAQVQAWVAKQRYEVRPCHIEIVTVRETGVAAVAQDYAAEKDYCKYFVFNKTNKYGPQSLVARNYELVEKSDELLLIYKPGDLDAQEWERIAHLFEVNHKPVTTWVKDKRTLKKLSV